MFRNNVRGCSWLIVLIGAAFAQQTTVLSNSFRSDFPGLPKNPPFISIMSVIWIDDIQNLELPLAVKGDVAEQVTTECRLRTPDFFRSPGPPSLGPETKIAIKYDADGHEIERDDKQVSTGAWSKQTQTYEGGRLTSKVGESGRGDRKNPTGWMRITYENERIVDMRQGHGDELQNHYVELRYDTQGRLTHFEYRQGKNDEKFGSTDIKYAGDTIESDELSVGGKITSVQVQKLDARGRVTDLRYSDLNKGELKLWYHASFRYDDQNRVIEQVSDDRELGEGDDYVPLPGRVVIRFDDKNFTRTEEFYQKGKLEARAIARLDRDGQELSLQIFDGTGKEKKHAGTVPDLATGKPGDRPGKCAWEADYDSHGNWTERRLWFTPADGSPKILLRKIERNLTYR